MREIKYRGQRKDTKEWIYGDLILFGCRAWIRDSSDKYNLRSISNYIADWRCVEIILSTVCQFTGLHDKNDKEIYEGDIIKQGSHLTLAKWREIKKNECGGHGCYYDELLLGFNFSAYYGEIKNIEVIGNIHDNPDLLKEDNHAV